MFDSSMKVAILNGERAALAKRLRHLALEPMSPEREALEFDLKDRIEAIDLEKADIFFEIDACREPGCLECALAA